MLTEEPSLTSAWRHHEADREVKHASRGSSSEALADRLCHIPEPETLPGVWGCVEAGQGSPPAVFRK